MYRERYTIYIYIYKQLLWGEKKRDRASDKRKYNIRGWRADNAAESQGRGSHTRWMCKFDGC